MNPECFIPDPVTTFKSSGSGSDPIVGKCREKKNKIPCSRTKPTGITFNGTINRNFPYNQSKEKKHNCAVSFLPDPGQSSGSVYVLYYRCTICT